MKLSKERLREIIKEEIGMMVPGAFDPGTLNQRQLDRLGVKLTKIKNRMWSKGMYDFDTDKAEKYMKHIEKMKANMTGSTSKWTFPE